MKQDSKKKSIFQPMMCVYAGPDSRYWKTRDPADVNVTDEPDRPAPPLTAPGLGVPDDVSKAMNGADKAAPADGTAAPAPDAATPQPAPITAGVYAAPAPDAVTPRPAPITAFVYAAPAQPSASVGSIGSFAPAAPKTKFCPACGASNLLTHKFCTECGAKFTYPDGSKRDV